MLRYETTLEELWNHTDECAHTKSTRPEPLATEDPRPVEACDCGLAAAKKLLRADGYQRVEFELGGRLEVLDMDVHTLIILTSDRISRKNAREFHSKVQRAMPRWRGRVFHLQPGEDVEHLPGPQAFAFYRALMAQFNPPLHEAHLAAEKATKQQEAAETLEQAELEQGGVESGALVGGIEVTKKGDEFIGRFVPPTEEQLEQAKGELADSDGAQSAASGISPEEMDFRKHAWERGECIACAYLKIDEAIPEDVPHTCRAHDAEVPPDGHNVKVRELTDTETGESLTEYERVPGKLPEQNSPQGPNSPHPGTNPDPDYRDERMPGPTGPSGREPGSS